MKKYFRKNESGAALLFALILIAIMLGVGLTLSTIFIGKLRVSIDAKSSVGAYYAADSGIEWNLYEKRIGPEAFGNQLGIESEFEIEETAEYTRSLGTYRGTSRAIEIIEFGASPTPTPNPICPDFVLGISQYSIDETEISYLITSSVLGTIGGQSLNLAAGGNYELIKTYARGMMDRMESITFVPTNGGVICSRTLGNINIPKITVPTPTPTPIPTPTPTPTPISTPTPTPIPTPTPTPTPIPTPTPTPAPTPPPQYGWVRINSNTYPSITGNANSCGPTMQATKTCNKTGVGMIVRMYNQTVGDGIGQGWSETPQATAVGEIIGGAITYTRFVGCSSASNPNLGPGARVYECKNTGEPQPAPAPPPAYQWVRIGTQPKFEPHVPSLNFETYWCGNTDASSTVHICGAGNVGKIAIAEYKSLGFVVLADRGTYYQGYTGNIQVDRSRLKLTGFNRISCMDEDGKPPRYIVLGAGYQGWNAWQCQQSAPVAMNESSSLFARIMNILVNFFTSIF